MTTRRLEERNKLRAAGALYPDGRCHFCGYNKLPPKAHWCSADCAQEFAAETKQIEQETKGSNGSD